jgi:hypothetical protein
MKLYNVVEKNYFYPTLPKFHLKKYISCIKRGINISLTHIECTNVFLASFDGNHCVLTIGVLNLLKR